MRAGLSTILRTDRALNRPVHLQIEPTTNCNLRCEFCNRAKIIKTPKQLTYREFKEIFDQIMPSKVSLSGRGEPLLADDLCKMIAYAKGRGCSATITTNFTLGATRAEELVDSGIENIRISIESSNAEVYRKIRGADFHGRVLSGIGKVNEIKQRRKRELPHVGFEVVMTKDSINECRGIISLAKEYHVQRINFRTLDIMGVEEKQDDLLFNMTKEEFMGLLQNIKELGRSTGVRTNVDELIENVSFVWGLYQGRVNSCPDCIYPWLQIYVNVDGEVAPCCALSTDEGISMGNVFNGRFADVWNSENYTNLRKRAREKKLSFRSCGRCPSKGLKWFANKYRFLRL
jgi:radical SAM protein with 4Fe4S-binding SPASM domain